MPNDQGRGHFHGIVHDNVSIFETEVHLDMPNNIAETSFQLFVTKMLPKMFFYFLSAKMVFFVKQVQIIWCKMTSLQFSHKVDHIAWKIPQKFEISIFVTTFTHLNEFWSISRK
jgi:hypothetical protein